MRACLAALVVTALLFGAEQAMAIPRFALREGATCVACHVNPSGGGMRNRYGRYVYGPTRLPLGYPGASLSAPLDVDVGDTLAFGADARFVYLDQRPPDPEVDEVRALVAMQGDLYVGATPFDGLTLTYDRGASGSFETIAMYGFGLGHPALSGYAKAGRFMPSFGLRLPNHNVFTRQDIGFGPRDKDTGAEVGFHLGPVLLQGGLMSGAGDSLFDDNLQKATVARAELLTKTGPVGWMLGASVYSNLFGDTLEVRGLVVDTRVKQLRRSVFWGAALGRFSYLGEASLGDLTPGAKNEVDLEERSFRSFQELGVLVLQGLDLTLNYEFREPDLKNKTGRARRLSAGFELYPIPSTELLVLYRHSRGEGPAEEADDGFDELIGMVHVFF